MNPAIDLNCDMGESYGAWRMGNDEAVLQFVTSANIACGFHGGDPSTMRQTVAAALAHGVALGAHPSLPDLAGFGRRAMQITPQEAYDLVVYQVGALAGVAASQGARLHHVKAHGALYNMAAKDAALARAICQAVRDAMITDLDQAIAQVLGMVRDGSVRTPDGQTVALQADTLCIHGDQPDALVFARGIRLALERNGIAIQAA